MCSVVELRIRVQLSHCTYCLRFVASSNFGTLWQYWFIRVCLFFDTKEITKRVLRKLRVRGRKVQNGELHNLCLSYGSIWVITFITRQAVYVQCNFEVPLRNDCCRGKAISITYSEFLFVALVIQHAKRRRRIILSSVASSPLPHFLTLSFLIRSTNFVWNVSHSVKNSAG